MGDWQRSDCSTACAVRSSALLLMAPALLALLILLGACTAPQAIASPIQVPNLQQCQLATDTSVTGTPTTLSLNCCLPIPANQVDFSFDAYPVTQQLVRQAAHTVSEDYIAKYVRAYDLMRSLPSDDPRSLQVQANIHCAFCNGAYKQAGDTSVPLQVHFSWLFLSWHRWYLYFHERILQSLLGDPSFALVFWNWDDQRDGGNVMPDMFVRNGTSLYDEKRDPSHLPPALVRLDATDNSTNNSVIINANLNDMYKSVVTANTAELFMGGAYSTGTDLSNSTVVNAPLGGMIENNVHNAMHFWTGDPNRPLLQDMGTFTTAARDPIFYAHHSNVDRLWEVWRYNLPGGPRQDHNETDFLDAEFYFYDENANLVKVNVRDSLDNSKFGISYPAVAADELWINYSPNATTNGSAVQEAIDSGVAEIGEAPLNGTVALGSQLAAIVKRPKGEKPRGKQEVLVVQGLEVTRASFVAVIVFVNMPTATASTMTNSAEYVGSFNIIPSTNKNKHLTTNLKFEIGDNIQRVGLQNEAQVVITLAVKGTQPITIQGLLIDYE
eukprot:c25368_g1_i1 orf=132-1790(-)